MFDYLCSYTMTMLHSPYMHLALYVKRGRGLAFSHHIIEYNRIEENIIEHNRIESNSME